MSDPSVIEGLGFGAAVLVLATFCMGSMSALRWVAIASNVAFIAYGYLDGLAPVLLLHMLLLPVNICRLAQMRSAHLGGDRIEERRKHGRDFERHPFLARLQGEALRCSADDVPQSWPRGDGQSQPSAAFAMALEMN